MLVYGLLDTAFLEQQSADPSTGATTGRFYLNTTDHVMKFYANSAWRTVMDLNTTQSASNKTFASPIVTTALTLNAAAECRFADSDSSNYVGFKAPGTVAANKIWVLPSADSTGQQALVSDGSLTLSWASIVTDPMTTRGDFLYRNSSNVNDRLAVGSANRVLKSDGTDPSWGLIANANIDAAAAIAYSKLTLTDSIVNADVSASAAIAGSKLQAASASNVGTVSKERIRSTWTPTLGGSGSDPTGVSYSVQQGYYAEVGQLVFFECRVEFTTYSGGSGNLQIKGFPVNIASGTSATGFHTVTSNINLSASYTYVAAEYSGVTAITLVQGGDNQSLSSLVLTTAAPSSGTTKIIRVSGVYMNQ